MIERARHSEETVRRLGARWLAPTVQISQRVFLCLLVVVVVVARCCSSMIFIRSGSSEVGGFRLAALTEIWAESGEAVEDVVA